MRSFNQTHEQRNDHDSLRSIGNEMKLNHGTQSFDARQKLDRHLELKRLRELTGDPELKLTDIE